MHCAMRWLPFDGYLSLGVWSLHSEVCRTDCYRISWEIRYVVRLWRPKAHYEIWQTGQLDGPGLTWLGFNWGILNNWANRQQISYEIWNMHTYIYIIVYVCVCAYAIKGPRHNSSQYANVAFNGRIVWTSNPEPGALSSLREQHQQPRWKTQIRMR